MMKADRYRRHPPIYRGAPKPQPDVETVPVGPGMGECPVCHAGVRLVAYKYARANLDVKAIPYKDREATRVPRVASHAPGGRPGTRRDHYRCRGSYEIPVRIEPLEES